MNPSTTNQAGAIVASEVKTLVYDYLVNEGLHLTLSSMYISLVSIIIIIGKAS